MFTAASFTVARTRECPQCALMGDWVRNRGRVSITEYYSAMKKIEHCHLQQHGWMLRVLCKVKKVRC